MELDQTGYINELSFGNRIIKLIVDKFEGDNLFVLLFANTVNEYLYDNEELYKILLNSLFNANESIMEYELYGGNLDENMQKKSEYTIFRNPIKISVLDGINNAMLLRAFDLIVAEKKINELSPKDYRFIKFIVKDGLEVEFSEIYKTSFNFSPLVIQDCDKLDRVSLCLSILNAFLECGPIQKTVFDEWYDNLHNIFEKVLKMDSEDGKKCREEIEENLKRWINDQRISQIVRDDIRKLAEVFPKPTIEIVNEE